MSDENINELSKKTLGSYIKKASVKAVSLADASQRARVSAPFGKAERLDKKADRRLAGVSKATDKLTKEDVFTDEEMAQISENVSEAEFEQLDELSRETLEKYRSKAKADPAHAVTRGKVPAAKAKTRAKRTAGFQTASKKITKIAQAEWAVSKKNHIDNVAHAHAQMPSIMAHHGYEKIGETDKRVAYVKHLPEIGHTMTVQHHKVHENSRHSQDHLYSHSGSTGWQSGSDRHHVEMGFANHTGKTKKDTVDAIHTHLKGLEDYHTKHGLEESEENEGPLMVEDYDFIGLISEKKTSDFYEGVRELLDARAVASIVESDEDDDFDFDATEDLDDDFDIEDEVTEEDIAWIAENISEEDFEMLDELSKKTLGSYIEKAKDSKEDIKQLRAEIDPEWRHSRPAAVKDYRDNLSRENKNRNKGIKLASDKLTKEDITFDDLVTFREEGAE